MKNGTLHIFAIAICSLLVLSGCVKTGDLSPFSPDKLVVSSVFSQDSIWKVYISSTRSPEDSDQAFLPVADAEVRILENRSVVDFLSYVAPGPGEPFGYYRSSLHQPTENESYEIRVRHPEFTDVQAFDLLPAQAAEIESFERTSFGPRGTSNFNFEFTDIDPGENYFQVSAKLRIYQKDVNNNFLFHSNKNVQAKLSARLETDPILAVEDGIEMINSKGILFADNRFNLERKKVKMELTTPDLSEFEGLEFQMAYQIEVRTVSENYYLYQKTTAERAVALQNPVAEPVEVHNNILNGFGNFSGYASIYSDLLFVE